MTQYFFEVIHLILRYFHVIAGVAWIGASFYFIWLDNNLQEPPQWKKDKGIKGDLWAVHGGGFYEVAKYALGPEKMPTTLHWFKWEAYTTWISGALLLTLLYYVGADAYLVDPSKSTLTTLPIIGLSVLSILLGYAVYEALCRSPLVNHGRWFTAVITLMLMLWAWALDQFMSDRAAYLHIGALIGTCMAANVFTTIIPGQRYMVSQVASGQVPDAKPGLLGKQRSIHNNYATLPVIFIMLSNHFSFTYSHNYGWLVLIALFVNGMLIRHYFNLKHQGHNKPMVLAAGFAMFIAIMLVIAPWQTMTTQTNSQTKLITDGQAMQLVEQHCQSCHSQSPTSSVFSTAPAGFIVDTIDQVKASADKVTLRVVISKDMPFGNMTQMSDDERGSLAAWLNSLK